LLKISAWDLEAISGKKKLCMGIEILLPPLAPSQNGMGHIAESK
jgi:hypothetical protein